MRFQPAQYGFMSVKEMRSEKDSGPDGGAEKIAIVPKKSPEARRVYDVDQIGIFELADGT